MIKSELENQFRFQLRAAGIRGFEEQWRIVPGRRFKWDFCWPEHLLACEIQGGIWAKGNSGHTSGIGITRDAEKQNLATLEGWHTMAFTGDHIKSGQALRWVQEFLAKKIGA